jgi:hypothetical protein
VIHQSRLCGKTLGDANFRKIYNAALVAVQTKHKSNVHELRGVCFSPGDVFVLQANNDSLLLERPPSDFYKGPKNSGSEDSVDNSLEQTSNSDGIMSSASKSHVWNDLRVLFNEKKGQDNKGDESREFLAAMKVSAKSKHINKTVEEAGLDSQDGLFLVLVERPVVPGNMHMTNFLIHSLIPGRGPISLPNSMSMLPVPPESHLKENDILWFAGDAATIADLKKNPGILLLEDDQIQKMESKRHDRMLVHAVIKTGPQVGKTAGKSQSW